MQHYEAIKKEPTSEMLMGFFLFLHVFAGEHDGQKARRQDHTQAAESQQDDEQDQATYTWPL